MTRLSDTERQAAKHKLIASRAQQNQAQAERDVEGLRCHPLPTDIAAKYTFIQRLPASRAVPCSAPHAGLQCHEQGLQLHVPQAPVAAADHTSVCGSGAGSTVARSRSNACSCIILVCTLALRKPSQNFEKCVNGNALCTAYFVDPMHVCLVSWLLPEYSCEACLPWHGISFEGQAGNNVDLSFIMSLFLASRWR